MGYNTVMHLIGITIKESSIPIVKRAIEEKKFKGSRKIAEYFDHLMFIDEFKELSLKPCEGDIEVYSPDEEYGDVAGKFGKWYEAETFAAWLKPHVEKGGRIIFHSNEGDGVAFGWEFDGKGRMRYLELKPVGKWE